MKTISPLLKAPVETNVPRIIALLALSVLTLLAITGCKNGDRNTVADADPTGVYKLVSVNGNSVPCDLQHEGTTMTIKSGVFTINADATCRSLMTFSVASHGDINKEVKATYTREGAELTMKWEGAGMTKGKVDGNTFTMNNEGMVLAYQK